MQSDQAPQGLTRIVALRPCGHIAAFASVQELLQGQHRCPQCEPVARFHSPAPTTDLRATHPSWYVRMQWECDQDKP
jgi:hypothetical protein